MKVLALPYKDLFEMVVHVGEGATIEDVVAGARENGVTLCAWSRESSNSNAFRVVALRAEQGPWERALDRVDPARFLAFHEPTLAVYGETQLVPSLMPHEEGTAFWIERVSLPTGDLSDADREDELFAVSHVNPLGGTESEQVRADGHVTAAEKYASHICDLWGESHFIHRDGHLAMRVVDSTGKAHRVEMGRDLSMRDHTIEP